MEVVANTMEGIILQFINVTNQYIVHLKLHNVLYQLYPNKSGKKIPTYTSPRFPTW